MRHISTEGALALGNKMTQSTLAREHISTQGTLACEHVSMQDTLTREHTRHVSNVTHKARNLVDSKINLVAFKGMLHHVTKAEEHQ